MGLIKGIEILLNGVNGTLKSLESQEKAKSEHREDLNLVAAAGDRANEKTGLGKGIDIVITGVDKFIDFVEARQEAANMYSKDLEFMSKEDANALYMQRVRTIENAFADRNTLHDEITT